jgi:PAS domain S-box-containing protein
MRLVTTAIEAAANGIVITNRQGVVRWVNPAFTRITGYTLEEMVGQTLSVLKDGSQPSSFYEQLWETILAGRVWHGELRNRHKDGHFYVEEQTIAPVSNDRGEITHFVGIKQDITQRRENEAALERRNAELAVMAGTIGAITASLEIAGVLRSVVSAMAELLPQSVGATVQLDDGSGRLVTRAASPSGGPRSTPIAFGPGVGVAGLAYRDRANVNVPDVAADARYLPGAGPPAYRSLLAVPIRSAERVLGVLCVHGQAPGAFGTHEEDVLTVFAYSAAIAMEHATEYEKRLQAERELTRHAERLEDLVEQRTAALKAAQVRLLEQHRLEQEVLLAAQVQASIVPRRSPDLPGYDVAGLALAARYVSGDLYDWVGMGPEHLDLALADIAGKGVPAAMMTSTARALLRDGAGRGSSPVCGLVHLNSSLYDDLTHAGSFITVVSAHLDRRTAAVDYASAGHTEVLWYQASAGACRRLPATGPPIGVLRQPQLEQQRIQLCPGDFLVFYSDGVTEAEDSRGELFGTDRLVEVVERNRSLHATALARAVVEAVRVFANGPPSDDLTLIVAKALPRTVPFRLPGDLAHLDETVALVRSMAQAYGETFAYELELAVSEIVTNMVEHAYRRSRGDLRGEVRLEPDRVQIDLYDDGLPFDPAAVPAPCAGQAREKGYGVHIARQLTDECAYAPSTGAGNHWRLVKTRSRVGVGDGR